MPNSARKTSGANQDNTFRDLTQESLQPAYAATLSPVITASKTIIGPVALTGALTLDPSISQSYIGDEIEAIFTNGTVGILAVTLGANVDSAGAASVAAGKKGVITLIFDGAKWVEKSRVLTA